MAGTSRCWNCLRGRRWNSRLPAKSSDHARRRLISGDENYEDTRTPRQSILAYWYAPGLVPLPLRHHLKRWFGRTSLQDSSLWPVSATSVAETGQKWKARGAGPLALPAFQTVS